MMMVFGKGGPMFLVPVLVAAMWQPTMPPEAVSPRPTIDQYLLWHQEPRYVPRDAILPLGEPFARRPSGVDRRQRDARTLRLNDRLGPIGRSR